MLALITVPEPPFVKLSEVPEPKLAPTESLVKVKAVSLNRGEVSVLPGAWDVRSEGLTKIERPGWVSGWDVAGVVAQPAANGRGPATGTRVVDLVSTGRGRSWLPFRSLGWHQSQTTSRLRPPPLSRLLA